MKELINKFKEIENEICKLGYMLANQVYIFNGIITNHSKQYIIIDPKVMLAFIKYCVINDYSPIIAHNHCDNAEFSIPDMHFMKQYLRLYRNLGGKQTMYFLVINSKTLEYSICKSEEGIDYEKIFSQA